MQVVSRAWAEAVRRDTDLDFHRLMEILPAAAYTTDAEGLITDFNQAAVEIWGRAPKRNDPGDRFNGALRLYRPDGTSLPHDQAWTALALREKKGFNEQEVVIERPDGTRRTALSHANPLFDASGKLVGAVNILVDITDRKQSGDTVAVQNLLAALRGEVNRALISTVARDLREIKRASEALQQSERQFRQLADAMPQIVWAADPNGYIDYYNERWYEYTGFPRGQYGQSSWEPILHPDDAQRCIDKYFGCIHSETPYEIEYRFKDRRTGGYRWFLGRAVPVRDESGKVIRWFGTCTDIDEAKRAQEKLKEADRRKDTFLATLAHELRNPLAPLCNAVQLLRKANGDGRLVEEASGMMARQLSQMVRLVDDLLDVSRITNGKMRLRTERIELASVVQSAVEATRPLIDASGHKLTVSLPERPVILVADATRLAQVIANLLNNAAKYTEPGGQIWLAALVRDDELVLSVRDTGIGLSAEQLPHVFEMFSQVGPALDRSQGGLGIGLSLVRGLVELHGGTIDVASEGPGRGSEFTVRIPLHVEEPNPQPQHEPGNGAANGAATRRRVLVVDDSHDSADSLAMLLRVSGHETQTAYDGLEGVAAAERMKPDVVLLDLGMPKLNGFSACRKIRQMCGGDDVVLIALSGWGQEGDRRRAQEAGFDAHLVKPVDPAELTQLLTSLRGKSESCV